NWTIDEVKKKLTLYLADNAVVKGFIVSLKNQPIAYLQYCELTYNPWPGQDLPDDVVNYGAGIDFFIGEPSFVNRGLGDKIITAFINQIIWPKYEFCVADPDIRNIASIQTLKKAGFVSHKSISDVNPLNEPVTLQLMIKNRCDS
ncbi:MAG: acetyltransferase, partial [Gammaproteobacteria bacterium]|nr:acetyltransferase [Gammaproteobacteria bacterium]